MTASQAMPPPVLPYGRQDISQADIDAVVAVLRSDRLTQGPAVERFERAVAQRCEAEHAVAVNSATSALHLACLALDVGPGDCVWTTPITFVASANAAISCGARVEFVDIDAATWNLCPKLLERRLEQAAACGAPLPKAVIVVHFAGEPADMPRLGALAQRYGFALIEDAAHAFGARSGTRPVGACEHSAITVFSLHPVKIITAGEGGLLLTQDAAIADRLRALRSSGIWRSKVGSNAPLDEPWAYEQRALGGNYRLSDIHASLGHSQLARVDQFLQRRHELAARYDDRLAGWGLTLPLRDASAYSALHLYPVLMADGPDRGQRRRVVFDAMTQAGIGVNVHYIPVHTQPFHREAVSVGHAPQTLPVAENYYARTLSLPLFGVMTVAEQDRVIDALDHALHRAAASPLGLAA